MVKQKSSLWACAAATGRTGRAVRGHCMFFLVICIWTGVHSFFICEGECLNVFWTRTPPLTFNIGEVDDRIFGFGFTDPLTDESLLYLHTAVPSLFMLRSFPMLVTNTKNIFSVVLWTHFCEFFFFSALWMNHFQKAFTPKCL